MPSEPPHDALARLTQYARIGLVTDMDGTIAPIVPTPDQAKPTETNLRLLRALHECLPLVAIVSGRGVTDLMARVGLPELVYVGNHGMEMRIGDAIIVPPEITASRPKLEALMHELPGIPGALLEDKGATISLHYRQSPDPAVIEAAIEPALRELADKYGLEMFKGRMVFEFRPAVQINKGTAFRALVEAHRLDAAIYIGDDTTDADALRAARDLREAGTCDAVGVGVASEQTPAAVLESADLMVQGVEGVEALLDWLLSACKASSS